MATVAAPQVNTSKLFGVDHTRRVSQEELTNPSKFIYIHNHHVFGNHIQATDITTHLTEDYTSPDFVKNAMELSLSKCKESGDIAPTLTISRSNFFKQTMDVVDDTTGVEVAKWKLPLLPINATELTFPADSEHCSHPITMKARPVVKESFVLNGAEYVWKVDRVPNIFDVEHKLVKKCADRGRVVARYSHPHGSMFKGGILSIDESEIDFVVAFVTCCVMIKKRAQKDVETIGIAT